MFKSDLFLVALTPDLWYIAAPLVWVGSRDTITVPAGFITDMASIPRAFRNLPLTDVNGVSRKPACVHDWIYAGERWMGKAIADDTLEEALLSEGMSKAGAACYYYAVKWFGQHAWNSDGRKLEGSDFKTPQLYQAWKATNPIPNPVG
ncbi:MAG: DUF1353 domain-containing protein [Terriglobia bacterium]|nr:DUF1353 domain-containing protein [Terriglobia bacterium]